ncbi:MAG: DUF4388 domain-containing protein [Acidobacteria bacterium]|nr:DUF4388 domain-containing protein [Acidobacteriota bacterium]
MANTTNHMQQPAIPPEVAEALHELQLYFADTMPPLMAVDAVETLMSQPPALTGDVINGWAAGQYQGRGASVPFSDLLFHAVKKIHLLGEYKLVEAARIERFIASLAPIVEQLCPPGDRDFFRTNLSRIGLSPTLLTSHTAPIYRQAGSESPLAVPPPTRLPGAVAATPTFGGLGVPGSTGSALASAAAATAATAATARATEQMVEGLRRFELLLARIAPAVPASAGVSPAPPALVSEAASHAKNEAELVSSLAKLGGLGYDTAPSSVVRALGQSLPEWGVAPPSGPDASSPGALSAMGRYISMADPSEGLRRYREMLQTAIEQANDGSLARAVLMFELADRLVAERKVDKSAADPLRSSMGAALDVDRLRAAGEKPEKRILVRSILAFFPATSVRGLLEALKTEERRDGRRNLLALLDVHGLPAREAALSDLAKAVEDPHGAPDWYYLRNLLNVLRRVPRPEGASPEGELGFLDLLAGKVQPAALAKEALFNIGQIKHPKAETLLVDKLKRLETLRIGEEASQYSHEELDQLLDRATSGLVRIGTPSAIRAIVEHALKRDARLGDTMPRLAQLSTLDLTVDPPSLETLLRALEKEIPRKVFGLMVKEESPRLVQYVAALSGTPAPSVRELLGDLSRKFPERELGRAATKALSALVALEASRKEKEPTTLGMTGDLEVFGLPMLTQTLAQSESTGTLLLKPKDGGPPAKLTLEAGRVRHAAHGTLKGAEAVYQLLERPLEGSFQFVRKPAVRSADDAFQPASDIIPLLFEGMRRYDELRRSCELVGDLVRLSPTGKKPSLPSHENDGNLVRTVWAGAAAGATALQLERASSVDAYRIRRLLAHWVEEGSMEARPT